MHKILLDRSQIEKTEINPGNAASYALGYSANEFKRLAFQAAFIRDLTEDVLRRAGLVRGMRVLDLGCGVGDVSILAGELVGPSGAVLGVDRSAAAVEMAQRRATEAGQCHWVRFTATEIDAFVPDEPFDAIIGRLILMYLPDPAAVLRRLATHLRPGGIVAFQELAMSMIGSAPGGPLFSQCRRWILETFERGGLDIDTGPNLFAIYPAAGLPAPQMIAASRAERGPDSRVYEYMAETLRSLLPAMERLGVATAGEVRIDTLAGRLRDEAVANSACIMVPPLVGAWARLPG